MEVVKELGGVFAGNWDEDGFWMVKVWEI